MDRVGLVAGARCVGSAGQTAACGEVVTTLENNIARGPVQLGCNGTVWQVPLGALRRLYRGCEFAYHNGTGYLLNASQGVLVTHAAEKPAGRVLFSLAVNHHSADQQSTSWVVLPGVPLSHLRRGGNSSVTVAANTENVQAIWDDDAVRPQLMAVVWRAEAPHLLPALRPGQALGLRALRASRPCILLVRQTSSCGSYTVSASDPSNDANGGLLVLRLTGISGATVCSVPPCPCQTVGDDTVVTLSLPHGFYAGQSTNVTCVPHACRA